MKIVRELETYENRFIKKIKKNKGRVHVLDHEGMAIKNANIRQHLYNDKN